MELIGKTSINPFLFYSGKICGYIAWIILILLISNILIFEGEIYKAQIYISFIIGILAALLIIISLFNLGNSTRLGLPSDNTKLKTIGLYKISRNPMYVGFNLLTISSMIHTLNLFIIIFGLYSIFIYHLIIRAEEKYLENRFGNDYLKYKMKTRRYL